MCCTRASSLLLLSMPSSLGKIYKVVKAHVRPGRTLVRNHPCKASRLRLLEVTLEALRTPLRTMTAGAKHLRFQSKRAHSVHSLAEVDGDAVSADQHDTVAHPYEPRLTPVVEHAKKWGLDLLHDPGLNKGTAFGLEERERLHLRGLLPPRATTMELQVGRLVDDILYGRDYISPEDMKDGAVTHDNVRQWRTLQELQDRNEILFYRVILDNFKEFAPVIYTPVVGWACLNYHKLYRRPRGMFFSAADRDQMAAMVYNWPASRVDAIVVTDGSRILGLGDLGVNGLGISIGKLDLYVAGGGFDPAHVLPIVVDVGTNNAKLRDDPYYLGLDQPRVTGNAYYEILDEFVEAVMNRWPHAVLQFEDFNLEHAEPLLQRYRNDHTVFNDDIQGTAATAVAGIYGAIKVSGGEAAAIKEQRVVMVGAGSAGMGVVRVIALGMQKHGLSAQDAAKRLWILDKDGLVTLKRQGLTSTVRRYARPESDKDFSEGMALLDVVRKVRPTVLIGLAGAGKLFTEEILKLAGEGCERPIIMPMSNPTSRMECTAVEAFKATQGRAIVASGSPQEGIVINGKQCVVSQANNMYIFPGLAFGAHLARSGIVTDAMLTAAAEALPKLLTPTDLKSGHVYPDLNNIRDISARVAADVIKMAAHEGHCYDLKTAAAVRKGDEALLHRVFHSMWQPEYLSIITKPHQ